MHSPDLMSGTADAAYAVDQDGRLVVWNRAAEQLFGHRAAAVLGRRCHEVFCGQDMFGNRFCDSICPVKNLVRRNEPARSYEMTMATARSSTVQVRITIIVQHELESSDYVIFHIAQRVAATANTERSTLRIESNSENDLPTEQKINSLTNRETEVLLQLVDGARTADIADRLFVSVSTVRNHIRNIFSKLCVHSRLEAISMLHKSHSRSRFNPPA